MAKSINLKHKRKGGYIMKWAEWMESPAYRDLKPTARCLLDELQLIYRPGRNGYLSIGTRRAAGLLRVTETTAMKAFYELVEHGFIVLTNHHVWTERKAREWRLTIEPYQGREPTDDWRQWSPDNPVTTLPTKKLRPQKQGQNCPKNDSKLPQKQQQPA